MRNKYVLTKGVVALTAAIMTAGMTGCDNPSIQHIIESGSGDVTTDPIGGSGTNTSDEGNKDYKPLTNAEKEYARQFSGGANHFGQNLFLSASEQMEKEENLFLSTYSVYSALVMLTNGMTEDSPVREEVLRALYLTQEDGSALGHDTVVDANVLLNRALEENQYATVSIANSLWLADWAALSPNHDAFMERIGRYGAVYEQLDLSSNDAVNRINDWVDTETNHMIPDFISTPFDSDTISVILNAVYFLGEWENEFLEANTSEQTFYGASGETTVDMMHGLQTVDYYDGGSYTCVQIPYKNGEYVMNVYLSNTEDVTMPQLYRNGELTQEQQAWIFGTDTSEDTSIPWMKGEVEISLPKFELENKVDLKEAVRDCGIEEIFTHMDLKELVEDDNLFVSDISQRAKLIVDEKGTEAAAVTMIVCKTESVSEPPVSFVVDEPFMFTIQDTATGTILFTGMINQIEA